jgi:hypothetical protein
MGIGYMTYCTCHVVERRIKSSALLMDHQAHSPEEVREMEGVEGVERRAGNEEWSRVAVRWAGCPRRANPIRVKRTFPTSAHIPVADACACFWLLLVLLGAFMLWTISLLSRRLRRAASIQLPESLRSSILRPPCSLSYSVFCNLLHTPIPFDVRFACLDHYDTHDNCFVRLR